MEQGKFKQGDSISAEDRQVIKAGSTLTVCGQEVFVVKNGVQSLYATALMTLIALSGKPDKPK